MVNKAELLIHPVRMKIIQALMRSGDNGLTTFEMLGIIKDVPQATLYRHIQTLLDAGIIRITKEKKVRSVTEKYYTLNEEEAKLTPEEWRNTSNENKVNYYSYYQLSLMNQYQSYLSKVEDKGAEDLSTFSLLETKLDDETFAKFQKELNDLMVKYYQSTSVKNKDTQTRTVAITIIPES
ncbi:helix-turn-helix domain-containing protein [Gracilibacillus saliphilus]|uniref:helix-turn-helix domain-containing protein n=1 Tax=Gracilibacillus saliphilus TaxID=543890 RepID=UPI0013D38462|nr:helix-turn-helix domain-containing protein [Gracilibacillus saliphilus]